MANQSDVKIVVSAQDNASQALSKIGGSISDSLGKISASAAIAGAGLAAFAGKAIKDFSEAEAAQKQLEHATLDVAGGTREQLKALQDLSVELEKKGVLDGDAIATGLAQLQTFGLSADMTKKLGSSLADLAVNQYGVNASSQQLTDSANMIANALNGQFGALEKSGIRFTDAQKAMIQYGSETEKASAIQEGFAQNLKYTNEVAKETTEGKMAALKVSLGNISEAIGGALTPALDSLVTKIEPIITKITEWAEKNPELIEKIILITGAVLAIVAALAPFLAILGLISVALPILAVLFSPIAIAIGLVVIAIGLLIAAIVLMIMHWDEVKAHAAEVWDAIKDKVQQVVTDVGAILSGWANTLLATLSAIWEGIKGAFTAVWDFIVAAVQLYIESLLEVITTLTDPIIAAWKFLWDTLKSALSSAMEGIKGVVESVLGWIEDKLGKIRDTAQAVANVVSGVVSKVTGGGSSSSTKKRALGGPVSTGEGYLVGENGPEYFQPYTAGNVIPNNRLSSWGGVNVTVNVGRVSSDVDVREMARVVGDELMRSLKQNQLLGA